MSDDPTVPVPLDQVDPLERQPDPPASRAIARDVALGAIAFVAVLLLLLGATRLLERGGVPSPSSSRGAAAPPATAVPPTNPTPALSPTAGASDASGAPSGSPSVSAGVSLPPGDPVLVGAGDIGVCGASGAEDTAAMIDGIQGTVFTAGDNVYESGTAREYTECYVPSWGRHLARTRPAPGNHDWGTADLAGYFGYFGAAAQGPDGSSWYSYDLGTWHVIVLDSMCEKVGGCDAASPQGRWLAADLAASAATCTLAIFHHPRFSSGEHGDLESMDGFWRPLYAAGVDVVVNGHDHDYERFAPQDPDGAADPARGIRQFIVGTGGAQLRGFPREASNSQMRVSNGYGVIKFTLHEGAYDWDFTVAKADFNDRGQANCH